MRVPLLLLCCFTSAAQDAVTTGHYDVQRTGANVHETILNIHNVKSSSFGRLGSVALSGCLVAQPLYVPGVAIPSVGTRNMVYAATTGAMLYGIDADDLTVYFARKLGRPVQSADIDSADGYFDFPNCDGADQLGPIGVAGTPVIDLAGQALYVVAAVVDPPSLFRFHVPARRPSAHQMLYKINLATGTDLIPAAEIGGQFSGSVFNPQYQLQRTALLLLNGNVYIAFSSHNDEKPYQGWLFSYDRNLIQQALFSYSPTRSGTGIWQSGGGPAWDGSQLFLSTGNNDEGLVGPADFADSILKLDPALLGVVDKTSFTSEANDWDYDSDLDLGSARVIPLIGTPFAAAGSKYGDIFIVDRATMGLVTRFQAAARHSSGFDWTGIYNGLALWNQTLYVWPGGGGGSFDTAYPTDVLRAYSVASDGSVKLAAQGQTDGVALGYQGAGLAISSNGTDPNTAILWALTPATNSRWLRPGSLHAYAAAASGIFTALWTDADPATGDAGYGWAKFSQPLIANGRVYVPTFSGQLIVYGLKTR